MSLNVEVRSPKYDWEEGVLLMLQLELVRSVKGNP